MKPRVAVLSQTLANVCYGVDGKEYNLHNSDDMYLLAFITAQHFIDTFPHHVNEIGTAKEYPFDQEDVELRKMWDLGFADGIGGGLLSER